MRVAPDLLASLDTWIASQPDLPSRPEAVRRLVEMAVSKLPEAGIVQEFLQKRRQIAQEYLEQEGEEIDPRQRHLLQTMMDGTYTSDEDIEMQFDAFVSGTVERALKAAMARRRHDRGS